MKHKEEEEEEEKPPTNKKISVLPWFGVIVVVIALGIAFRYTQLP